MTKQEMKQRAKELGIRWADVEAVYRELRALEKEGRELDWEIRKAVWLWYATTNDQLRWWRYGMERRFRHEFTVGDYTTIPRWDTVSRTVAYEFPGMFSEENCSEEVYEYMKREWIRVPKSEETWGKALQICEENAAAVVDEAVEFEFGANVF